MGPDPVVEVDLVDLGIQPVVVRAQRPQHAPDRREAFVVVERGRRFDARRHRNRQHDVAVVLARRLAHGAADRLDDIHLAVARAHEQDRVERRHVDPLGQAARVGQDPAGTVRPALQPLDPRLAVEGVMLPVDMPGLAAERLRPLGFGQHVDSFASGLRNPVGIAFRPGTDDLYVVVNERDGLGDGLVPDYFTRIQSGEFFGWPYAYSGPHPAPTWGARDPDLVALTKAPDLMFQAHSAPLGLVFYDGQQFPEEFHGDAFVALHGSWNSAQPTGYKVVRIPFGADGPAEYYENFVTGFWLRGTSPAQVFGRPVGLAVAADGSLLIADDTSQTIWRVSYDPD